MSSAVMSLSICFEIFALRFSAALGIARTSSALRSLARKFGCARQYEQALFLDIFGCARQYEQALLHSLARKLHSLARKLHSLARKLRSLARKFGVEMASGRSRRKFHESRKFHSIWQQPSSKRWRGCSICLQAKGWDNARFYRRSL